MNTCARCGQPVASDGRVDFGGRFIPHASTWLNQARWEDEVDNGKQCGDGSPVPFEER